MFPDGYQLPDPQHVQRAVEEAAVEIYVGVADYLFAVDGDWLCLYRTVFKGDLVHMPRGIGSDDLSDCAD